MNDRFKAILCLGCGRMIEYDTADYLNIRCECGCLFPPPPKKKKKKINGRRKKR